MQTSFASSLERVYDLDLFEIGLVPVFRQEDSGQAGRDGPLVSWRRLLYLNITNVIIRRLRSMRHAQDRRATSLKQSRNHIAEDHSPKLSSDRG